MHEGVAVDVATDGENDVAKGGDLGVPPGPSGWPIIGPLLDLRRDVLGTMYKAMLRYGDVVRFAGGPPGRFRIEIYGLFHPDAVQDVRTSGDDVYSKDDPSSVEIRAVLGDGLLTSVGDVWRRQRRIADPLFTSDRVSAFFPIIASEAEQVVADWRGAADNGSAVDLHASSTRVARRFIGRAVLGADAERLIPIFSERLPYLSGRAFARGASPLRIPATWPTPGNRKAARAKKELQAAVEDAVARRRREPTGGDDLVSQLVRAPDPEGGPGFDDREIRDQVLVFLLAGGEQPATSIAFVLHLLGHHPDAQRRAHEEIDAVVGDRPLTPGDVESLPYTAMAVKEAMRLYPPAYGLPRQVERDQYHGGYSVPAGVRAVLSPWVTHRHPGFWDDPERFDPDRFTAEQEAGRHPFAYFAFGGGPHRCLGAHLAMLETMVATVTVLQAYRVITRPAAVPLFTGLPLRPDAAMPAQVIRR